MAKKELNLENLKNQYKGLQAKYNLPDFNLLNKDFNIEKISETETDFLTKEIRRFIADKVYNYLRFLETMLNPVNAPIFIFSIIKSLTSDDKKRLTNIYEKLSIADLELIKLDIDSSEEKDSQFIKQFFDSWQVIKKELIPVLDRLKYIKEEDNGDKSKSKYFG